MRTLYRKEYCRNCGKPYDPALGKCPNCGKEDADPSLIRSWQENTPLGPGREISLFLTGWMGLSILELIVQLIVTAFAYNQYSSQGLSGKELTAALSAYISSGEGLALIFIPTYLFLFLILLLIVGKGLKRVFARFANPKTYLGIIAGIILIIVSSVYSYLISLIPGTSSNQNQSNVVSIISYTPIGSLLILGLVGPFCEELTYRLGLFNFLKRKNIYIAYIFTSLIFACIHFDWSNITSVNEWLNFPDYLISGFLLALTYDKLGIGASYLAHATNNVVSIVSVIIKNAGK